MVKALGIAAGVALLAFVGTFGRAIYRSRRWPLPPKVDRWEMDPRD